MITARDILELRRAHKMLQKDLAEALGWNQSVLSSLETYRLKITYYHHIKITEYFFGKYTDFVRDVEVRPAYWDQPRSPIYNLSYPREMMLHPLSEEQCAKQMDATNRHQEDGQIACATPAEYAVTRKSTPKNTLFRYSETTPAVGDMYGSSPLNTG